ncbi:hypothetical protein Tco_0445983 [Tanacetum coccineum]
MEEDGRLKVELEKVKMMGLELSKRRLSSYQLRLPDELSIGSYLVVLKIMMFTGLEEFLEEGEGHVVGCSLRL